MVIRLFYILAFLSLCFTEAKAVDSLVVIKKLQQENVMLKKAVSSYAASIEEIKNYNLIVSDSLNMLNKKTMIYDERFSTLKEQLIKIDDSNKELSKKSSNMMALLILSLMLLFVLSFFFFTERKNSRKSILSLQNTKQDIEEQVVLFEKITSALSEFVKKGTESDASKTSVDHSLILKIADEMVKLQNNIQKLDIKDKNVVRIEKSLTRMKTVFTAYGYEIVDLIGMAYTDNMPFEARFIPDDSLNEGESIISGMDKLMIRFNGEMIQAPKIVVRQN